MISKKQAEQFFKDETIVYFYDSYSDEQVLAAKIKNIINLRLSAEYVY